MADEVVSLPTSAQVGGILTTNTAINENVQSVASAITATGSARNALLGDMVEAIRGVAVGGGGFVSIVVTAATRDSVTVTGQTVSLYDNNTTPPTLRETKPYNGQPVSFAVPVGLNYRVGISDALAGHFAPGDETGTANATTAVTLTYTDPDHFLSFAELSAARDAIVARNATDEAAKAEALQLLVGVEIADTYVNTGGTSYSNPRRVVDADWQEDENGTRFLGLTLMQVYCTQEDVSFDNRNQQAAVPSIDTKFSDGTFYYGWNVPTATLPWTTAAKVPSATFYIYDGGLYTAKADIAAGTEITTEDWSGKFTLVGNLTEKTEDETTSLGIFELDGEATYSANDLCLYNGGSGDIWTLHKFDGTNWARALVDAPVAQIAWMRSGTPYSAEATYDLGDVCAYNGNVYRCKTAIETPEAFTAAKWTSLGAVQFTAADDVPYASYLLVWKNAVCDTDRNIVRYGYNRYRDAAQDRWLSHEPIAGQTSVGEWWTQPHTGQIAPGNLGTTQAYQAGCSEAILAAARKVKIQCYTNGGTDQGKVDVLVRKFWLPSSNQLFASVNANEGAMFPYFRDLIMAAMRTAGCTIETKENLAAIQAVTPGDLDTAYVAQDTGFVYYWSGTEYKNAMTDDRSGQAPYRATKGQICANRIFRRINSTGSAAYCRLRSASRSHSYYAWYVITAGYLNGSYAGNASASVPACVI